MNPRVQVHYNRRRASTSVEVDLWPTDRDWTDLGRTAVRHLIAPCALRYAEAHPRQASCVMWSVGPTFAQVTRIAPDEVDALVGDILAAYEQPGFTEPVRPWG